MSPCTVPASSGRKLKFGPLPSAITWPLSASTCHDSVCVSNVPGSVNVPVRLTVSSSLTYWSGPASTTGTTFNTESVVAAEVTTCPCPSATRTKTLNVLGPFTIPSVFSCAQVSVGVACHIAEYAITVNIPGVR